MKNELVNFDGEIPVKYMPAQVNFEGYDEFKKRVVQLHDRYRNYAVSPENLKEAQDLSKKLGKFHRRINKQRTAITNEIKQPAKDFKAQIDDLLKITDETKQQIDSQLAVYEKKEAEESHQKKMVRLQELCQLANIDPEDIEWQKDWDNKSITNKRFDREVNEQISIVQQKQQQFAENAQVITQKADELGLPVDHWIEELGHSSLPGVLSAMDQYKKDLDDISKRQHETKVKEAENLKQAGDRYIDPNTGEVKEKVITLRLEVKGNQWQMKQLQSFLKDNGIEYQGLEG